MDEGDGFNGCWASVFIFYRHGANILLRGRTQDGKLMCNFNDQLLCLRFAGHKRTEIDKK